LRGVMGVFDCKGQKFRPNESYKHGELNKAYLGNLFTYKCK
jgi:hypothetical protein